MVFRKRVVKFERLKIFAMIRLVLSDWLTFIDINHIDGEKMEKLALDSKSEVLTFVSPVQETNSESEVLIFVTPVQETSCTPELTLPYQVDELLMSPTLKEPEPSTIVPFIAPYEPLDLVLADSYEATNYYSALAEPSEKIVVIQGEPSLTIYHTASDSLHAGWVICSCFVKGIYISTE